MQQDGKELVFVHFLDALDEGEGVADHGSRFIEQGEVENAVAHAAFICSVVHQMARNAVGKVFAELVTVFEQGVNTGKVASLEHVCQIRVEAANLVGEGEQVITLFLAEALVVVVDVVVTGLHQGEQALAGVERDFRDADIILKKLKKI